MSFRYNAITGQLDLFENGGGGVASTQFDADSGSATPDAGGVITLAGGGSIVTSAAANTVTITLADPLPVGDGGTGTTSLTDGSILVGDGANPVESLALTDGQLPIGSTGASPSAATLTAPANGIAINSGAGSITFVLTDDLAALEGLATFGLAARTAANAWTTRNLVQPAAGITIADDDGVLGNPTFALADDLAAVEALAGTGLATRTAADTWNVRTITAGSTKISVSDGDGVLGNPTIDATEANFTLDNIGGTLSETKGGTGQTTYAEGDVLYASAANTLSKLPAGSDGEVLTLASGVPSWAGAPSGNLVFLGNTIATNDTTVDITGLDGTYDNYLIIFNNITAAINNSDFLIRTSSNGGVSYDSGATDYDWLFRGSIADQGAGQSVGVIIGSGASGGINTAAGQSANGWVMIWSPASTNHTLISTQVAWYRASGDLAVVNGTIKRNSAADVDAVQFLTLTGSSNLSGTFKLYGINDA